jgi:hypothetical protein
MTTKNHFFDNYRENNEIIRLSSLFPTITSTIVCSLHTGLPPEIHGLLGHKIYFPEIGNIINTLNSNVPRARENQKDALVRSGVNPKALLWNYNPPSLYNSDKYKQINFLRDDIAMTGLSHFMLENDAIIPYRNYIDGLEKVRSLLKRDEKFYIHFYMGDLDDISHAYGPFSLEYQKTSSLIEYILSTFIKSLDHQTAQETLITISADHGQNTLNKENIIKFTQDDIKQIKKYLYAPMGKSGRLLHFYPFEDKTDDLKNFLEEKIGDGGIILTFEDDLHPLFSTDENYDKLFERLGNLIVLLKPHFSIERDYNYNRNEDQLFEFRMIGHHGSLSEDELVVPFFIDKISEFKKYL